MCTSSSEPAPVDEEFVAPVDGRVAAALVENHRAFLAFLERRVGDRAAAEDILQAAFTKGLAASCGSLTRATRSRRRSPAKAWPCSAWS